MRRAAGVILLVTVLGACGSREATTTGASPSSSDAFPVGDADSPAWVAGDLPDGYHLVLADEHQAGGVPVRTTLYSRRPAHRDPSDAPLRVKATPTDRRTEVGALTNPGPVEVRGHPGIRYALRDDGQVYGVALAWEERPGLTITVEAAEGLNLDDARLVAEGVAPYPIERWPDLVTATDPVAADGTVTPGMDRVEVGSGSVDGDRWVLTALLPPDYPLVPEDNRAPCYELAYRGEQHTETGCLGHPTWARLGGQIFVTGEAPAEVNRVTVTPAEGSGGGEPVEVGTATAGRGPDVAFWVAPMPEGTCAVDTTDAATGDATRGLGPTGPLPGDQHASADWSRCSGG